MELFNVTNKENRWDIQWYYHLTKNLFAIKLSSNFSSKYAGLIYFEQMENLMSVMSMVGLLWREIQNIGMIVLLFWRKKSWISFCPEEIVNYYSSKERVKQKDNSILADR